MATYVYDVVGNRIEADDYSGGVATVTRYASDDTGNVWTSGSSTPTTRYVRPDGVDALGARVTSSGVAWYLTDHEGSVRSLTDNTGTVKDRLTYNGFGGLVSETAASFGDAYKYTGREYDGLAKLQYNRARWYDAGTGRWISEDPAGFDAGDVNLFRYVGNGPTDGTDPSGMVGFDQLYQQASTAGQLAVTAFNISTSLEPRERLAFQRLLADQRPGVKLLQENLQSYLGDPGITTGAAVSIVRDYLSLYDFSPDKVEARLNKLLATTDAVLTKVDRFQQGLPGWLAEAKKAQEQRNKAADALMATAASLQKELDAADDNKKAYLNKWRKQLDAMWPEVSDFFPSIQENLGGPLGLYYTLGFAKRKDPNFKPGPDYAAIQNDVNLASREDFRVLPDGTLKALTPEAKAAEVKLLAQVERMRAIDRMGPLERLGEVFGLVTSGKNSEPLDGQFLEQLKGLVSPQSLALMGGFFGAGMVLTGPIGSGLLTSVGYALFGYSFYDIGRDAVLFLTDALGARSDADFNDSANHLSAGVAKGGTQLASMWAFGKIQKRVREALKGKGTPAEAKRLAQELRDQIQAAKQAERAGDQQAADAALKRIKEIIDAQPELFGESAPQNLKGKTVEELAELRRNGEISDKDLKKSGFNKDEIAEINDAAKDAAAKARGGHDRKKVIDSTEGSKKALDDALEDLRKNPSDPAARKAVEDAQRQYDEIQAAKRQIDLERRRRGKE